MTPAPPRPPVPVPGPGERPEPFISALLERMTPAEKVGQLIGALLPPADAALAPGLLEVPPGVLAVPAMTPAECHRAVHRVQRELTTRTRLGIPALAVALGGPRGGVRFPPPLARAAAWDRALVADLAAAAAAQHRASGIAGQLGPDAALAAGPDRAGAAGCFGGAPALAADLLAAHVRGAQGPDPQRIGAGHVAVAATGFGGPGGSPDTAPMAELDRRTMRAEVLVPAEAAVRAGVAVLVPGHGGNDGLPAHVDHALLRTLLRDEWGFDGAVLAAPGAIAALVHHHRVAEDLDAARAMACESGVDAALIAAHSDRRGERVTGMVRRGALPQWLVDEAVAALLRLKWRLGLWADPLPPEPPPGPAPARAVALADRAAAGTTVLLADPSGALPLAAGADVRVWAPAHLPGAAALVDRLAAAVPGAEVALCTADALPGGRGPLVVLLPDDRSSDRAGAAAAAAAEGRPVVAVLLGGSPAGLDDLVGSPAALLLSWSRLDRPAALAAVLGGTAEPGGRLPVELTAGGHRFPLGHGNGYTGFAYSGFELPERLPPDGAPLRVGCVVTNTGTRAGKEVVQVYLRDRVATVVPPDRALVGFAAVRVPAGRSVRVRVAVPAERFAVWDRAMRRTVEPGDFDVLVGRSATDIRLSGLVSGPVEPLVLPLRSAAQPG